MPTATSHYDGIQVRGVRGMLLRGNNFDLGPWEEMYNAAIFLENANGGNYDVVIDRNWIGGGGYTLYLFAANVQFTNNVMTEPRGHWGLLYPGANLSTITRYNNIWESTGQPATF
jgi:hypothetical protein